MKKKIKKLLKNKRFLIFMGLFIIFLICIFALKEVFIPSGGSNYGNRLEGIKNNKFETKDQDKVVKHIKSDDKVTSAKINMHGKIINVIYNVKEDVSIEDSRKIAEASLEKFPEKIRKFYDIQFMITKEKEKGEEVEIKNEDGTTAKEIKKSFPIMGYKNSNRDNIVW